MEKNVSVEELLNNCFFFLFVLLYELFFQHKPNCSTKGNLVNISKACMVRGNMIERDPELVFEMPCIRSGRPRKIMLVKLFCGRMTLPKIDGFLASQKLHLLEPEEGKKLNLNNRFSTEVYFIESKLHGQFGRRVRVHRQPGNSYQRAESIIETNRSSAGLIPDGAHVAVWEYAV